MFLLFAIMELSFGYLSQLKLQYSIEVIPFVLGFYPYIDG